MKSKKFLFAIVVVLLMMISVLPGCHEGQPVEADKLVIPSSMSDGHLRMRSAAFGTKSEAWDSAHDAAVGYVFISENHTETWVELYTTDSGYKADISRGIVYFDTSGLPDDATIYNATLRLYGTYLESGYGDWGIIIQSGMPISPHDSAIPMDYGYTHYSGNGGAISSGDMGYGYKNIPLNEHGIGWIDKTGATKFCLREWPHDTKNVCPTDVDKINRWQWYSYEQGQGYWPELVVNYETPPLLEKYAPVLYFHPDEDYFTNPTDSILEQSDLMLLELNGYRKHIQDGPISESQLPEPSILGKYYLDMWNATGSPIFFNATAEPPDPSRFTDYRYTVYGRQVDKTYEGHSYTVLQYWFFYPYNKWWNCHEGDMERVQIIYDKATGTPINMTFGQHRGGETVPWDGGVSLIEGTHPKVFAAVGSHASYPSKGLHPVLSLTDNTSDAGTVLLPESYTLVDISSEPSWVEWSGTWGFYVPPEDFGASGPDSPANVVINKINVWDNPIEWANNPTPPSILGKANCSVRLHAYDSNGNHTGLNETGWIETEIPGTYFYVPIGNQSDAELMWIYTEENLTFTLEADEVGECNFSFARCVGGEITTNYTHVEVIENTTAKVDTGEENPLLLMELDFDSNGVTDEYKFPDSNSTLKGQVNFTGRDTPPNDRWIEPFVVKLFEPGNLTNVLWTGVATTNNTGVFTIDNIPSNTTYDIGIKNCTCLSELETNITVGVNETTVVDFGTTREGDCNDDDMVNAADRGLLYDGWGTTNVIQDGHLCDLNRDGWLNAKDRGLMYDNWGQCGDLLGV